MARQVVGGASTSSEEIHAAAAVPLRARTGGDGLPPAAAMQAAAEWFARLRTLQGQRDHGEAWRQWLADSDDHRRAWQAVEVVCARLQPLEAGTSPERALVVGALESLGRRRGQRRRLLSAVGGAVVLGGLGSQFFDAGRLTSLAQHWSVDERTGVGERRELSLGEGTRLWLNTATRLNRGRHAGPADLELLEGEILVVMDRARPGPLTLAIPQGRLAASEGRFGVRVFADHTRIAVHEGQVGVEDPQSGQIRMMSARHEIDLGRGQRVVERALPVGRDAWTRGLILAADISLGEVIAELSRYSRRRITISDEAAGLRVFGGFPVNQPDKALAMLGQALPIRIRRVWPWETRIDRA